MVDLYYIYLTSHYRITYTCLFIFPLISNNYTCIVSNKWKIHKMRYNSIGHYYICIDHYYICIDHYYICSERPTLVMGKGGAPHGLFVQFIRYLHTKIDTMAYPYRFYVIKQPATHCNDFVLDLGTSRRKSIGTRIAGCAGSTFVRLRVRRLCSKCMFYLDICIM